MRQRAERVASLLVKEISAVVREDLHSADLGFVTFLGADVTKDLRTATVYYSVLGSDEDKKKTDLALRRAMSQIKKLVNNRIQLRYAIDIRIIREDIIEHAFKIEEIFKKIKNDNQNKEDSGRV